MTSSGSAGRTRSKCYQREPRASVLGPEGRQLHLGWRHMLLGGCLSPRRWRCWNPEVLLLLMGAPVTIPATSPGDVLLPRGSCIIVVIAWLHVLSFVTSVKVASTVD